MRAPDLRSDDDWVAEALSGIRGRPIVDIGASLVNPTVLCMIDRVPTRLRSTVDVGLKLRELCDDCRILPD